VTHELVDPAPPPWKKCAAVPKSYRYCLKAFKMLPTFLHFCRSEDEDCKNTESDHDSSDEYAALSQYEVRTKKRIAENLRSTLGNYKRKHQQYIL